MRHTVADLRNLVREMVDDPGATEFTHAELLIHINLAYQEVVREFQKLPTAQMVNSTEIELTPVDGQREYVLDREISRIVTVQHVRGERQEDIHGWRGYGERDRLPRRGIYTYRDDQGRIVIGLSAMPSQYHLLRVRGYRSVPRLVNDTDVPVLVPDDYHESMAWFAAWSALETKKRPVETVAGLYAKSIADMQQNEGAGLIHRSTSRPWM